MQAGLVWGLACGCLAAAAEPNAEKTVEAQARQACAAMARGEFDAFVKFTHPRLVEAMGGRERLARVLKSGWEDLKTRGIRLVAAEVRAARGVAEGGQILFAVVPYDLVMDMPQGRVLQPAWLLGISADRGQSWTFVDGAKMNAEQLKRLFPDFPQGLELPLRQPPVVERKQP